MLSLSTLIAWQFGNKMRLTNLVIGARKAGKVLLITELDHLYHTGVYLKENNLCWSCFYFESQRALKSV